MAGSNKQRPTPLPVLPMFAIISLNSTPSFQINMIFPFIPWMVEDLRSTREMNGFYVGIMASVYMVGQTLAAMIWPQLSDRWLGRKRTIILGHFGLVVPILLFGLSKNYWLAVFWRLLNGLLQCNRPITNAIIAEMCDETNQSKAYGLGAVSWGVATMVRVQS